MTIKKELIFGLILLVIITSSIIFFNNYLNGQANNSNKTIELNEIDKESRVNKLLYNRQSVRNYNNQSISFKNISEIIWSAEGINVDGISGPTRTSPSAGATDPLVIYVSISKVSNLKSGLYRYEPTEHLLHYLIEQDISEPLAEAALGQSPVAEAPACLIITANYEDTTNRYGERGIKYVHMEAGAAAQNALLTAESNNLAGVIIGAFENNRIKKVMGGIKETPLLLIPIGHEL